jgi:hypothetical protein
MANDTVPLSSFRLLLDDYIRAQLTAANPPGIRLTAKEVKHGRLKRSTVTLSIDIVDKNGRVMWPACADQEIALGDTLTLANIAGALQFKGDYRDAKC